jgi:mono/diheme cytochrome c family protein
MRGNITLCMLRCMSRWLVVLLLAAGCHREVAGGRADGAAVFAETCARCHGESGKPSESMAAQLHVADLTDPAFGARATHELITNQVRNGSANKVMPSFVGALSDPQIDAVADYVLTLATRSR